MPQFEVFDGDILIARVDFRVEGTMVVVEFDGKLKYKSIADLWAEKQPEDRRRRMGYATQRVIWSDFATPRALVRRLARAAELYPGPSSAASRRQPASFDIRYVAKQWEIFGPGARDG